MKFTLHLYKELRLTTSKFFMSFQHTRKQGIVRKLMVSDASYSSNLNVIQVFKMPSKANSTNDAVSILIKTKNASIEISKASKTHNDDEERSGITARQMYRGHLVGHDTIFDNKEDNNNLLMGCETPIIDLNKVVRMNR